MAEKLTLTERKRADIVAAAIAEFSDKGYQAASMDSLSTRANVSKRTVYNHFENKEALFQEIARQMFEYAAQMTGISYQSNRTLEAQLTEFADKELELLASARFRDLVKVMMAECIHSPELAEKALSQLNEQQLGLKAWIGAAIADNKIKPVDPEFAANQFLGLIKASAFWPQILRMADVPDSDQKKMIAEHAVGMFLAFYTQ